MFPKQHFKLTPVAAMLAAVSVTFPVTGYCVAAGHADFVIGDVVAVAADGSQRILAKGSAIDTGEAINTAAGARAQIRFTDGGYVSLQPSSQFRVDDYRYENKTDGEEKGFFSLLKGGLRAITGAIGHVHRDSYRVNTSVATIGIRGTGYNAVLGDGLLVNVGEGAISLTNNAGTLVVTSGGSAFVADFNTPPALTFEKPKTPPAGFLTPIDNTFSSDEGRDAAGGLAALPQLASGPGYALAHAWTGNIECCVTNNTRVYTDITATFTGTSQLTQYDGAEGGALGTAHVSFSATDGIIGWGRWNGGTTVDNSNGCCTPLHPLALASGDTFHYVVGIPTPSTDIDALNNVNGTGASVTATYSLMGGTRPTGDGAEGGLGNLNSGSLIANFGPRTVDAHLQISFPAGTNYSSTSYNIITPTSMAMSGSTFGTQFGGSATATGGQCSPCYINISGFFAGANASRAGVAYSFQDSYTGNVAGVAAFAKSSSVTNPPLY